MTFSDDRIRALLSLRPFAEPWWRGRWSATYQISDYLDRGARIAAVCYGEEGMGDRLKERVALVSGADSSGPGWGNGKAAAVLFAREGAKVLAADLNLDAALETKQIIEAEGTSVT